MSAEAVLRVGTCGVGFFFRPSCVTIPISRPTGWQSRFPRKEKKSRRKSVQKIPSLPRMSDGQLRITIRPGPRELQSLCLRQEMQGRLHGDLNMQAAAHRSKTSVSQRNACGHMRSSQCVRHSIGYRHSLLRQAAGCSALRPLHPDISRKSCRSHANTEVNP